MARRSHRRLLSTAGKIYIGYCAVIFAVAMWVILG